MPNDQALVRAALRTLSGGRTRMNAGTFLPRLVGKTKLSLVAVRSAVMALAKSGELECKAGWERGEPMGQVTLRLRENLSPTQVDWNQALESARRDGLLSDTDGRVLRPLHAKLDGFDPEHMRELIRGLVRLRSEIEKCVGVPRFIVSAEFLLGSSKLLDSLPRAALRAFGIDPSQFADFPPYLVVAGPPNPDHVVLTENPHAFEVAIEAPGADRVAWVATFGHGLSMSGEQYGRQLVDLLLGRGARVLVRAGSPPTLETLLGHPRVTFWGDLDVEGLRIFSRLRAGIENLQLSILYRPMVERLLQKGGHPYAPATGKGDHERGLEISEDLEPLAALCRPFALDQEDVRAEEITRWLAAENSVGTDAERIRWLTALPRIGAACGTTVPPHRPGE